MKKLVWVAAVLLGLSVIFPNGVPLPTLPLPAPSVPAPEVVAPDPDIVTALSAASRADKKRIAGIYTAMKNVVARDGGKRINTTEKFAEFQAATLQLAVRHTPGDYPNLGDAIESVFRREVGTDDVVPLTDAVITKLSRACDVIVSSTK
jgi:hypothetical protein